MAYYEKVKQNFLEEALKTYEQEIEPFNQIFNEITARFNSVEKSLKEYKKTGKLELDSDISSPSSTRSGSLKENQRPNTRNNRTKRDVSTESENGSKRAEQSNKLCPEVNIKKERISKVKETTTSRSEIIKKEKEDMPAPTQLPPRKKKVKQEPQDPKLQILPEVVSETRVTRSKVRQNIIRDSDVILQSQPVPVLVISDSDEDNPSQSQQQSKNGSKRKSNESDNESDDHSKKRSKSSSLQSSSNNQKLAKQVKNSKNKKGKKKSSRGVIDDELITDDDSDLEDSEQISETINNKDETVENKKARPIMDTTIVVKNPKCTTNALLNVTVTVDNQNAKETTEQELNLQKDLMTDDDDSAEDDQEKNVAKSNYKILHSGKKQKQLFSPFESSPVKKKVEAFERLGAENTMLPVRTTRTKTRAGEKDSQKVDEEQEPTSSKTQDEIPKHNVREKLKVFTPTVSKFNPKVCSTSRLPNRHGTNAAVNSSSTATKSGSAVKASQEEFRQREMRRHAKEAEALKKKEAMIQAQVEEKKRRREEKVMKAQQQREAIEKESMKKIEIQKIKDERHRQLLLEREEKLKKQKAEHDRKLLLAKQKAAEEKRKEEEKRAKELASSEKDKTMIVTKTKKEPIYLTCKPPRLPTTDCYDSDEPGYENRKYPTWTNDIKLQQIQLCLQAVGSQVTNSLFCCQAQTPDLQDIFQDIDPVKLKRTSSAHWRVPPRYTLMCSFDSNTKPIEESIIEGSDEDSD